MAILGTPVKLAAYRRSHGYRRSHTTKGGRATRVPPSGLLKSCGAAIELAVPHPRHEVPPPGRVEPEHRPGHVLRVADQNRSRRLGDLYTVPGGAAARALAPGQIVLLHSQPFLRTFSHSTI